MSINYTDAERVVGFEMEYSPSIIRVPTRKGALTQASHIELFDQIRQLYAPTSLGYMTNGYRLSYQEALTELSTPESTPNTVGAMQLGSEQIMLYGLQAYIANLEQEHGQYESNGYCDFLLPLRASDSTLTSGFHENYAIHNPRISQEIGYFLADYAASSIIWTGQGLVVGKEQNDGIINSLYYRVAQKVGHHISGEDSWVVEKSIGSDSDGFIDRYEFRRNNYPVSYWQLKHRAAYTSAVIRAAEQGELNLDSYSFYDSPTGIAHTINQNPHALLKLTSHTLKRVTAAQFQHRLAAEVANIAKRNGFPDYETTAAQEVAKVTSYIRDKKLNQVAMQVPWVLKMKKIFGIDQLNNLESTIDVPYVKANQLCIVMDSRGRGCALDLIRSKQPEYSAQDALIALSNDAPCLEIAKRRGRAIAKIPASMRSEVCGDWMTDDLE